MATTKIAFELTANGDNLESSVKDIKTQLKEAQAEADNLAGKFGATSKEAQEAADNVQAIGDQVAELNEQKLDDAAKTVSALSATLGGLQGALDLTGMASEETAAMLTKIQGALSVGDAIQNLAEFKTSIANTFNLMREQAIKAFQAIRAGIGMTGIGLLLIALGAVVAYWDEIKTAVSGVSDKQKELLNSKEKSVAASEKELDAISKSESSLKLQGKTEREILNLKIAKTKQSRSDLIDQLELMTAMRQGQIDAAQRNKDILQGIVRFMSVPLTMLLKTIDMAGKALGQDFGLETTFSEGIAKMIFDPEKVKTEADAAIETTKEKLRDLQNMQDGFTLQIQDIDKQAAETAAANSNDLKNKLIADAKEIRDAKNKTYLESIKDEKLRAREQLRLTNEAQLEDLANSDKSANQKKALKIEYEKQYELDRKKLIKEQNEAILKEQNAADEVLLNARLAAITDENFKKQQLIEVNRQKEIDKQADAYNNGLIDLDKYNIAVAGINADFDKQQLDLKKQIADAETKIAEEQKNEELRILEEKHAKQLEVAKSISDGINFYKSLIELNSQEISNRQQKDNDIQQQLLDNNIISQEQYEANIAAINEKAEKKKRQLQRQSIIAENAMTIANIILNTLQANAKSIATFPLTGGQPWVAFNTVAGVLGVATTIAQTAKALSALGGGSAGGGNVSFANKGGAPLSPQAQTTSLNQGQINQLASATSRAFVLESDVSGNQERIQRLNRAARIN